MTEETINAGLNTWQEELAKFAQDALQKESKIGSGLNWISTAGGQMSFQGIPIAGNKLAVVILADAVERHYYTERYNPGKLTSPSCFALSVSGEDMQPHPNVSKPCNGTCTGCPNDEWGTADQGKGKACKEVRRLALLAADDLEGDVLSAPLAYLKLSVTSVKLFSAYVSTLASVAKRPVFGVVTEISIERDPKNQFKFVFRTLREIPMEKFGAVKQKFEASQAEILRPYNPMTESEEKDEPAKPAKSKKY